MKKITEDILRSQALTSLRRDLSRLADDGLSKLRGTPRAEAICIALTINQLLSIPFEVKEAEAARQRDLAKIQLLLSLLNAPTIDEWEAAREKIELP